MAPVAPNPAPVRRIPTWALVVAPILAAALSNADVLLLANARPDIGASELTLALASTVPLSAAASGLTLWFLLRLRREVDRRAVAERELRSTMADLGQSLERERMLRRELDHRVRNNLAALLGLVGMYEDSSVATGEVVRSLRGKIVSLREAYALIAATHGEGIELADLLRAVVAALLGPDSTAAITIEGPSVRLTSREANAFAMILQELLTNAAKHGALRDISAPGPIQITWTSIARNSQARVTLRWTESPVAPPRPDDSRSHGGLGLSLIRGFAESDLRGAVSFSHEADRWTVELTATLKVPEHATDHSPSPREVCV